MRKLLLLLLLPALSFAQMPLVVGSGGSGLWAPPVGCKASCLTATSTVTFTADCLLADDGATPVIMRSVSFVADVSVAGPIANGRDQSSAFSINSWAYLHVIWGTGNVPAGLLSASSIAPTLPTGYSHFALVSAVYIGGTATQFAYTWSQVGRKVDYKTLNTALVNNGTATSYTSFSSATVVPPIANFTYLIAKYFNTGAGVLGSISTDGVNFKAGIWSQVASISNGYFQFTVPASNQTMWYSSGAATGTMTIYCEGWEF